MSNELAMDPPAAAEPHPVDGIAGRPRKLSADNMVRTRREAVALDGLMYDSSSLLELRDADPGHETMTSTSMDKDEHSPSQDTNSTTLDSDLSMAAAPVSSEGPTPGEAVAGLSESDGNPSSSASSTSSVDSTADTDHLTNTKAQASSLPGLEPPKKHLDDKGMDSPSSSKRQSMFLGDHIAIPEEGPVEAPSSHSPGSNDEHEDMKEVQIETEDPSHLFWVPFHLHPEIAPNEYNKWLYKHGVDSNEADGIVTSRSPSVTRRKSVLSALYNPEDDTEDRPAKPAQIPEQDEGHDFLSGVFSVPLEQMGEPPLKTKTSLRRSVSLSVSSPTRDQFPSDIVEEDLMNAKRPGGLERGGLSLLRRSARTKIRRNSTASNDTRNDVSRLRQTVNANGEYPAVSLVDPGPLPLPSPVSQTATGSAPSTPDDEQSRKGTDTQPLKRFVSTLRDSSKPTITTYVEPHLLEQQRKENEANAQRSEENETPSFRISAPGKLENTSQLGLSQDSTESDRKVTAVEKLESFTISYPIPPPVKLSQNLLQQPSPQSTAAKPSPPTSHSTQPSTKQKHGIPSGTQPSTAHAKKPSTWSWLWGKEKSTEKSMDNSGQSTTGTKFAASSSSGNDVHTQTAVSGDLTVKKQSALSMLFSRNGKATSAKAHATTAESTHSATMNGYSGQGSSADRPKYSNYNRLPIHIERAIYRLSHVKLANPRRPLHEQVLISNMMFWYLGVIQQQQMLQQQADLQQQQNQQQHQRQDESESKTEGKDGKSKSKSKKRKSQKKKNGQRSPTKPERIVKSPEYEQQHQKIGSNQTGAQGSTHQPEPSIGRAQADNPLRSSSDPAEDYDEESMIGGGGGAEFSDSYEESDGEEHASQLKGGSPSDTLAALSIQAAKTGEEDDDVPLAHYHTSTRQSVPVS